MNRLVAVGFLLIVAGAAVVGIGSVGQGTASTGGFILIGPVPIVFGTGNNGGNLALLSAVLGGMMLAMLLAMLLAMFLRTWNLRGKGDEEIDK